LESNTKTYVVPLQDEGLRLDVFLKSANPTLSRSHLKKLIDRQNVKLNAVIPKAGARLKAGDRIHLQVPPPAPMTALPEPIPLDIVFEDESALVVNKPPGLVVHPAAGNYSGTLVNGLLHHCRSLPDQGNPFRPGIVHRLDKNTSGVLVVAKNDHAHQHLAAQFKDHTINRVYLALVLGSPRTGQGTISSLIGRHPKDRKKMSSRPRRGRQAVTHWEIIKRYPSFSLLRVRLETGRTHQIRVHLASIHHPVAGDPDYGGRKALAALPKTDATQSVSSVRRQLLHAATLGFIHPLKDTYAEFSAPPPEDFQSVLEKLEEGS
jgi:23S rRNA pseudouridine1911/1915/1917 synthase